jgi:hypothetical protein
VQEGNIEQEHIVIKNGVRISKVETTPINGQGGLLACANYCRKYAKCGGITVLGNGECLASLTESVSPTDNLEPAVGAVTGIRVGVAQPVIPDPNPPAVINGAWCDPAKGGKVYTATLISDKRLDLICHNAPANMLEFAVSVLDGSKNVFKTAGKQRYPHCPAGTGQILVADMNKDGISDIFCNDATLKKIVFSFFGSKLELRATWTWDDGVVYCPGPEYKLYIGIFDSTGKTQLLCHRFSTGDIWSRYVQNTPSSTNIADNYCKKASAYSRFWMHDVNNDNYDDMLCLSNDVGTTIYKRTLRVRLAKPSGGWEKEQKNLSDLYSCSYLASTIVEFVYINGGDRFYDITCNNLHFNYNQGTVNPIQSDMRFYLSSSVSGVFPSGKVSFATNRIRLCTDDKGNMHLGDFFGNKRFQFLCHGKNGLELTDTPYKP